MIRTILIIIFLNFAFLGVGGGLLYYGYETGDIFMLVVGGFFTGMILLMDVPVTRWLSIRWFKRKNQMRRLGNKKYD